MFATCPEKLGVQAENDLVFLDDTQEITDLRRIRVKGVFSKLLNLTDYCGKIIPLSLSVPFSFILLFHFCCCFHITFVRTVCLTKTYGVEIINIEW